MSEQGGTYAKAAARLLKGEVLLLEAAHLPAQPLALARQPLGSPTELLGAKLHGVVGVNVDGAVLA